MTLFGPIIHGGMVEQAALATIKEWLPAYLAEAERQMGRVPKSLPLPRSYTVAPDAEKFPEAQLPAIVIVAPGTAGDPRRNGKGEIAVAWSLGIAVLLSGRDQRAAEEITDIYAATIRTLLLQRPSLGGFAAGLDYVGEANDIFPISQRRTLPGCLVNFVVQVEAISSARGGPVEVPDDPYADPGDWPQVESADVEITKEAIAA